MNREEYSFRQFHEALNKYDDEQERKRKPVNITISVDSSRINLFTKTLMKFRFLWYPFYFILSPQDREKILLFIINKLVKVKVI